MKSALTFPRLICLAIALFIPSVALAQKTSVTHDPAANFVNYKTFSFASVTGARNPYVNDLILKALERELTAKGLTKVDANGDLRVSYLAATGFNLQVADVGHTANPSYSGMMPTGVAMWDVTTGTLLIDLYDKTDRIVFRGSAKDVLQRSPSADLLADAKVVTKTVNKAVAKIFKKYPVPGKQ
ncbi:MAG TPA: DUF4136 domain-containing protein [Pyrinomonadaceae bacterium]|nr:DUF4136 domain-containing protein [Pyrinomonadaceae bacterium]